MLLTPDLLIKVGIGLTCGGLLLLTLIILANMINPKGKKRD